MSTPLSPKTTRENSRIQKNYSFRRAALKTDADDHMLAAFFPKTRRLQRRRSEEVGAVAPLARPALGPIPVASAPLTPRAPPTSAPSESSAGVGPQKLDDLFGEEDAAADDPGQGAAGSAASVAVDATVSAGDDESPSPPSSAPKVA